MKKSIRYTNEPMSFEVVEDFLPPPSQLVLKENTIKVTLTLKESSVKFFKQESLKAGIPYHQMLKRLIEFYAAHHSH